MNRITSALVSDVTSVYAYFTFSYGQKKQLSPGPDINELIRESSLICVTLEPKGLTGKTVKYKLMEFDGFDCIFNVV